MRGAALACLSLLLAAGCDRKPAEPPAAPPASVPVAEAPAPAAPVVGLEGAYAAISNTAVGVTGDLTASAGTLRFAQGQSYRLEEVSTLKGASAYASTQGSFAGLINVADTADLSLFKVTAEDPGKARNGGFCGATPTTYLVTYAGGRWKRDGGAVRHRLQRTGGAWCELAGGRALRDLHVRPQDRVTRDDMSGTRHG